MLQNLNKKLKKIVLFLSLKNFIKKNTITVIVFCVIIAVRFIWIDIIPPGMQYDEVEYSLSSKTFQLMKVDLSGVKFPDSLFITKTLGKISPIPYIILSPIWQFVELNTTTYRSLYIILNILTSFVFMYFLHYLFKKKEITILGGILFLLNPWSYFLSRHAMDGPFALLFYLLGSVFLLKPYTKKNIIFSFIFYFLGCFSYHGAKLYLIPLIITISVYKIVTQKLSIKKMIPYVMLIAILSFILAVFIFKGKHMSESIINKRSHEFVFTNTNKFASLVNSVRTASIQTNFQVIMINKVIYAIKYFINNYFEVFSPKLLFLEAEVIKFHGFFYLFEIIFLLAGFVALNKKNKMAFWLIIILTVIAPITTATSLSGFSVINRAIFLMPMLLIFITFGLYTIYQWVSLYIPKKLFVIFTSLVYFFSFLYFQYIYFFILPVQLNMHYETNLRIMAKYLSYEKKLNQKIYIITPKPQVLFSHIVFYLPTQEQEKILKQKQTFGNNLVFNIDNIIFTLDCPSDFNPNNTYIINHDKNFCYKKIPSNYFIINQIDAGVDYSIVNGKACSGLKLGRWHYPIFLSDYKIESMNKNQFCKRWIASPPSLSSIK